MNFMRIIIAPVLLSLSGISLGLTEATVIGDNLNVRKLPNGQLVEQLAEGQLVKVVNEKSGWSQVVYIKGDNGTASYGWVSSRYLELQFEAESTECARDPINGGNHCLSVMAPNLQCKMDEPALGYSGCSIDIKYELSVAQERPVSLNVSCTSSLNTRNESESTWNMEVQSKRVSHTEISETGNIESMELIFEFGAENPARYARVSDTKCELDFSDLIPEQA